MTTTVIGLAIIGLIVAIAVWHLSVSMQSRADRSEDRKAVRTPHQPWDSTDGRANR